MKSRRHEINDLLPREWWEGTVVQFEPRAPCGLDSSSSGVPGDAAELVGRATSPGGAVL